MGSSARSAVLKGRSDEALRPLRRPRDPSMGRMVLLHLRPAPAEHRT